MICIGWCKFCPHAWRGGLRWRQWPWGEFNESPNLALFNALNLLTHGYDSFIVGRYFELYTTFGIIIKDDRGIDHVWRILNNDRTVVKLEFKIWCQGMGPRNSRDWEQWRALSKQGEEGSRSDGGNVRVCNEIFDASSSIQKGGYPCFKYAKKSDLSPPGSYK